MAARVSGERQCNGRVLSAPLAAREAERRQEEPHQAAVPDAAAASTAAVRANNHCHEAPHNFQRIDAQDTTR